MPIASASTTVTSAGSVPVGGTSAAPASFEFCENAAGDWHSGGTISVTITDASGASTLSFTDASGGVPAPSLSAPGSLGASVAAVNGGTVTVNLTTDDALNLGCFTVGTLYITAAGSAATGVINATSGGTVAAATYGVMTTSATGLLAASAAPGATSALVVLTSACPFVNVGSGPGPAGDFTVAGNDGGAAGTASALVAGQQTLSGFAALSVAVPAGGAVSQANVPNCSTAMSLPAPGSVGPRHLLAPRPRSPREVRITPVPLCREAASTAGATTATANSATGRRRAAPPPSRSSGITTATAMSVGNFHTCALLASGSIECWGFNGFGGLGNGTTTGSSTPVAVSGITTAIAIAAGGYDHTCALLTGGSVECWGDNWAGMLGNADNDQQFYHTPVAVQRDHDRHGDRRGRQLHLCPPDGWQREVLGRQPSGELGNGVTSLYSLIPVVVSGITHGDPWRLGAANDGRAPFWSAAALTAGV